MSKAKKLEILKNHGQLIGANWIGCDAISLEGVWFVEITPMSEVETWGINDIRIYLGY